MKKTLISIMLVLAATAAVAQERTDCSHFDYKEHSHLMYDRADMKYAFEKFKPEDWQSWQQALRGELRHALGIDIIEKQNPGFKPYARFKSSEDVGYAYRERWEIWTEKDVNIPFIVMRPKDIKGKLPLMITPHGHGKNTESYAGVYHSEKERESGEVGERNVAVQAAQHGFLAIAPTARAFGDTRSPKDIEEDNTSSCREMMLRDALVGRTLIGDRVWDIMKLIDWALENLPVDENNIIVSGNSGGGTATAYAGAIDTRIAMSLPASAFCDYEPSIGMRRHCECNYVPGIMNLCDMGELGGLTAPRGFCIIHGAKDAIFPIEGTRHAFEVASKVYQAAGVPQNCELYEGPEGHRYYKAGAWDFIERHLGTIKVTAEKLPAWQEGNLDIHFINTGGGNASLVVMPDGTTMLVDAGDMGRGGDPLNKAPLVPDVSKTPGQWIAEYIRHFAPEGKRSGLDYAFLTHYHDDHFGTDANSRQDAPGGYPMSGIMEVGTLLPFGKLIDRGNDYIDTEEKLKAELDGYSRFVAWQCANNSMVHEAAKPGSSKQVRMLDKPKSYRNFNVRVLFAQGRVADPVKDKVASSKYDGAKYPGENNLSAGLKIDYGKFNFYTGGDIPGIRYDGALDPDSMESRVADIIGPVDVAVLNHHGNRDTQNEKFVSTLQPRVWIGQSWGARHPGEEVIRRLTARYIYPGDRDIYSTYMSPVAAGFLGRYLADYKSRSGHIVVRVAPGGDSYDVYVLDEATFGIKMKNHYESR